VGVEDTDGVDKEGQTLLRSETKISLRQLVFDGWETSSRVAGAKAGLKAATAILNAQEQEISLQAAASYIDVFRSNKFVELAKKNLKNHQQLGQKIKRRAQTGYGNKANLSQVNARVALANARLIRFQGELDTATAQFQESVNELPPEGMVLPVIPASLVSEDVDSLIAIAVMDNPALKASSYRISEKVALTDQVESEFMPKIYVNASRSWNEDVDGVRGKNHDALGMVNLKYNLFNGAGSLARLDKANYELDNATEQMKAYKRQVIKEVRSAYIQLQVAHSRLPALKTHVQMANKVLKASYKQFKLGQRSILDLLDQRNELFQAEIALLTEQTRKIYAAYRLLASQGGLLNYLQQQHTEVTI
jgi:outer membrane protein, adhesin transport system